MDDKIILYTTHCPQCKVLEKMLQSKNIKYEVCEDVEVIRGKGFLSVPMLEVNGKLYNCVNAFKYIREL